MNWPRNWAAWNSDTRKVYKTAPFEAWDNAWFNAACAFWPVKGPAKPLHINGAGLPGILMLQGTLDPATPYAGRAGGAQAAAKRPDGRGRGRRQPRPVARRPPNNCVKGYLNRYLATGALPAHPGLVNATCPALPDATRTAEPGARPGHPSRGPRPAAIPAMPIRWGSAGPEHGVHLRCACSRSRSGRSARHMRSDAVTNVSSALASGPPGSSPAGSAARCGATWSPGDDVGVLLGRQPRARGRQFRGGGRVRRRARIQGRRCSSIVGPRTPCASSGACSRRTGAGPARSAGAAGPGHLHRPLVPPDPQVRLVRPDELDTLLPASVAMFTEEVGVPRSGRTGERRTGPAWLS